ncbi:VOC family protein [Micromonospora sp. NPDC005171]|uniref:VOC family protein n=1 Tax=Micromonospora sp. NPDC005171 TaxID=3156866 RepID=UPI0033A0886B
MVGVVETLGRLAGVTVDCRDPQRLADFWSVVLGGRVTESLPGWASRHCRRGRPGADIPAGPGAQGRQDAATPRHRRYRR